jgi:hypothetical protein
MGLKVALIGLSQSTRHLAPWKKEDWELWGLAWDTERYSFHRTFEMHDMPDLQKFYGDRLGPYLGKIEDCSRLYMAEQYLPGSIAYPFEEVGADVGPYWCSSLAYMLALAIHEKAEEIGIYGVDMRADDEYGYQKPNMEYLVGLARGRGIAVHIPDQSPLCKFVSPPDRDYAGRYGRS